MARAMGQKHVSLASSIKGDEPSLVTIGGPTQHNLERLSSGWKVGSASMPSSEETFIYDASQVQSPYQSDTSPEKENVKQPKLRIRKANRLNADPSVKDIAAPHVVQFVNRPEGTPLFTIIEQRSLATLKSKASTLAFSIRATQTGFHSRRSSGQEIITRGPKAASADDVTLQSCFPRHVSSPSATSSGTDAFTHNAQHKPHHPPFQPPYRRKTPDGVGRWPGDTGSPSQVPETSNIGLRQASVAALNGDASHLRRALSGYVRRIRTKDRPVARPWRPPVSAHSTVGHNNLSSHPFHNPPNAQIRPFTAARSEEPLRISSPIPIVPQNLAGSLEGRARTGSNSASLAQRALGSISGNAVPVNPARALSPLQPRTAALPAQFVIRKALPPPSSVGVRAPLRSHTYSSDTLRTLDMIQQFPQPPPRSGTTESDSPVRPLPLFAPRPQKPPSIKFIAGDGLASGLRYGDPAVDLSRADDSPGHRTSAIAEDQPISDSSDSA